VETLLIILKDGIVLRGVREKCVNYAININTTLMIKLVNGNSN
jgi:hypothetical protein